MVIDYKADPGVRQNRRNRCGHAANFVGGGVLGAQLNQVRSAVAKLAGDFADIAAMQVGRINKGVETALIEGFHEIPERAIRSVPAARRRAILPGNWSCTRRAGNLGPVRSPVQMGSLS